jgi:hypothetical protein
MEGVKTWLSSGSKLLLNLFPDTVTSIFGMTTLRTSLSMYFFLYNILFSLLALVTAHWR